MQVEVNLLAVLAAALSTMVVGSIWYSPRVFGNSWMRLAGIKQKDIENNGFMPMVITLVVSFISAYVLAYVAFLNNYFFQNSFLQDALTISFLAWIAFTAARIITHDAFEGRRKKLTILNISHELVTFMVMGLIIGYMGL